MTVQLSLRWSYTSVKKAFSVSDNGLVPNRHHAIIWTMLFYCHLDPQGKNISEILMIRIQNIHQRKWTSKCHLQNYSNLSRLNVLTLNVWGPSYLSLTRSISWLLMPWLHSSPWHQQPWYWLSRIGRSLSYLKKDFNYLCHVNVEEWHKM